MEKIKKPPDDLAERCLEIRCRSRSGKYSSIKEHKFCLKMMKKYPEWYDDTLRDVFNRTVPFGSTVRWEDFQHKS